MPIVAFKCPDGRIYPVDECLKNCYRPRGRCLSLPTLTTLGYRKSRQDVFSTTQLLNPTRMEYLKLTRDYSIDPFDMAFALLGTRHHGMLEAVAKKIEGLEPEKYLHGETTGILDLLEPVNGGYRLIDYKTYGSYAVAKLLGLKENNPGNKERYELALQLNNYRVLVKAMGFEVSELKTQITVRDGGTFSAKKNGIDFKIMMYDVGLLDDDEVINYFKEKADNLRRALETGETELCDYEARWGGNRCKGYCDVFRYCREGAMVNNVEYIG